MKNVIWAHTGKVLISLGIGFGALGIIIGVLYLFVIIINSMGGVYVLAIIYGIGLSYAAYRLIIPKIYDYLKRNNFK